MIKNFFYLFLILIRSVNNKRKGLENFVIKSLRICTNISNSCK